MLNFYFNHNMEDKLRNLHGLDVKLETSDGVTKWINECNVFIAENKLDTFISYYSFFGAIFINSLIDKNLTTSIPLSCLESYKKIIAMIREKKLPKMDQDIKLRRFQETPFSESKKTILSCTRNLHLRANYEYQYDIVIPKHLTNHILPIENFSSYPTEYEVICFPTLRFVRLNSTTYVAEEEDVVNDPDEMKVIDLETIKKGDFDSFINSYYQQTVLYKWKSEYFTINYFPSTLLVSILTTSYPHITKHLISITSTTISIDKEFALNLNDPSHHIILPIFQTPDDISPTIAELIKYLSHNLSITESYYYVKRKLYVSPKNNLSYSYDPIMYNFFKTSDLTILDSTNIDIRILSCVKKKYGSVYIDLIESKSTKLLRLEKKIAEKVFKKYNLNPFFMMRKLR